LVTAGSGQRKNKNCRSTGASGVGLGGWGRGRGGDMAGRDIGTGGRRRRGHGLLAFMFPTRVVDTAASTLAGNARGLNLHRGWLGMCPACVLEQSRAHETLPLSHRRHPPGLPGRQPSGRLEALSPSSVHFPHPRPHPPRPRISHPQKACITSE